MFLPDSISALLFVFGSIYNHVFVWKKLGLTQSWTSNLWTTIVLTNQHCVNIYCFVQSEVMISFLFSVSIFHVKLLI